MMTREEMCIAIAEKCGHEPELHWQVLSPDGKGSCLSGEKWECENWLAKMKKDFPGSMYSEYHVGAWKHYQRYTEDLNAMHEAEKVLIKNDERFAYYDHLMHCCNNSETVNTIHATAAQRAQAFCRVFWPERFEASKTS